MNPHPITPAQAKKLRTLIALRLRFFSQLVDRMNRVGFIRANKNIPLHNHGLQRKP